MSVNNDKEKDGGTPLIYLWVVAVITMVVLIVWLVNYANEHNYENVVNDIIYFDPTITKEDLGKKKKGGMAEIRKKAFITFAEKNMENFDKYDIIVEDIYRYDEKYNLNLLVNGSVKKYYINKETNKIIEYK